MWLPADVIADVDRVATIHYVTVTDTQAWNQHRSEGELRLLTGWCWTSRRTSAFRQGFKTRTVCYRDAWYSLVANSVLPSITRRTTPTRLRVIDNRRKTA